MQTYEYLPFVIGGLIGLIFGYFIARRSAKEHAIYGGPIAKAINLLGSIVLGALPMTALLTVLLGGGFVRAVVVGFGMMGVSLLIFVVFAVIEQPARAAHQTHDEGWTAQKAKESGL